MTHADDVENNTSETRPSPTHRWIGLFAAHLMALDTRVTFGYAIDCAVRSYDLSADAEPQAAAEFYALVHFPEDVTQRWAH